MTALIAYPLVLLRYGGAAHSYDTQIASFRHFVLFGTLFNTIAWYQG